MNARILSAVFAGGALGSASRYLVILAVVNLPVAPPLFELVATAVVNLSGALALGVIHSVGSRKSPSWKSFWGPGFAGGFTTMSGLAMITGGAELGLYLFWIAVATQLVLGVLAYALGKSIADAHALKIARAS